MGMGAWSAGAVEMITRDELASLCHDPDTWLAPMNDAMGLYEIDTDQRIAYFLAQIAHESANFLHLEENLDYSAARLLEVFPTHFSADLAADVEHNPVKIGNIVYANRMGNGDVDSGDGYLFRGRGLIQITGRNAYRRVMGGLGVDVQSDPDKLLEPLYACLSAAWFWRQNGCNDLADAGFFVAITRKINGGLTGEPEREALLKIAQAAIV